MTNELTDLPIGFLVFGTIALPARVNPEKKQFATEAEALQDQAELRQAGGWISVTVTAIYPNKKARNTAFQERQIEPFGDFRVTLKLKS
jgi:hypothetical protein